MALGDPFDLVGDGAIGVVLVHGFTGTPYEMQFLGQQLARAGYTVHGMRLPGHGTTIEELDATSWQDWAGAVEDAFDELRLVCARVAVVGQSLGGLLALHLAAHRPDVAAVGSLATPLWTRELVLIDRISRLRREGGLAGRVAGWAARGALRWPAIPKLVRTDVRDKHVRRENPCYDQIPTRALGELARFMKLVGEELDQVHAPVLVLHGRHDHTAPVGCAARIAARTRAVRTRLLDRSYHLITADVERDIVAAEVIEFLRRNVNVNTGDLSCAM